MNALFTTKDGGLKRIINATPEEIVEWHTAHPEAIYKGVD